MITSILLALSSATFAPNANSSEPLSADKLKVVATIGDLADIVREVGGDRVDVTTIARGRENLHAVSARPSHIIAMNRADLFVQIGLSLETAFVPGLMNSARNQRIEPGQPGFCNTSEGWEPLDKPTSLSRKNGDVHPQGNPHMNMDPRGGKQIAQRVFEGLCRVDAGSKSLYETRYKDYQQRLDAGFKRWSEVGDKLKGKTIVVYHKEYDYLADCWGMQIVGSIEVRPGIPPTPDHLAELIEEMKKQHCTVILTAVWSNNSDVARLAEQTGAKIVELPNQCNGIPGTETWIGMMDLVHQRLAEAFGVK